MAERLENWVSIDYFYLGFPGGSDRKKLKLYYKERIIYYIFPTTIIFVLPNLEKNLRCEVGRPKSQPWFLHFLHNCLWIRHLQLSQGPFATMPVQNSKYKIREATVADPKDEITLTTDYIWKKKKTDFLIWTRETVSRATQEIICNAIRQLTRSMGKLGMRCRKKAGTRNTEFLGSQPRSSFPWTT